MSRSIDLTKPLSDEDKRYLRIRGRENEVLENESQFAAEPEDDDSEPDGPLEPPYDQHSKKQLIAEIERRNALPENAEYEDISTSGPIRELAARLVEDDEASEE